VGTRIGFLIDTQEIQVIPSGIKKDFEIWFKNKPF
jgi:hypothetical protein